jgi:hypothetical protein
MLLYLLDSIYMLTNPPYFYPSFYYLNSSHGLVISDNSASGTDSSGVPHVFAPENVALTDGALSLKVSAYSGSGNVLGAQVSTESQIKYASVRTVQKSSKVPGVREGNFFYREFWIAPR